MVLYKKKIALIGGGERELSVLSQFHKTPDFEVIGVYDPDINSVAIGLAEIIGIPTFTDRSFVEAFSEADFIVTETGNPELRDILDYLKEHGSKLVDISNSYKLYDHKEQQPSPNINSKLDKFDEALQYLCRISDLENLLRWILDISVEALNCSKGSIMLYSASTDELYIGFANGLSDKVVKNTRVKLGEGIAGKSAELRKAILTRDVYDGSPPARIEKERQRIMSSVTAPIIHEDNLLGVLNISADLGERELTEDDRDTVSIIARKVAPILSKQMLTGTGDFNERENEIRSFLEDVEKMEAGFHKKLALISKFLSEHFEADTVAVYTATDEGDWLILGGSDNQLQQNGYSSRVHCIKGSLAKAYLNGEEIVLTESREGEEKAKESPEPISSIYLPLRHAVITGILVVEFSDLLSLERFMRHKDNLKFQLGLFVQSLLREARQKRKMQVLEKLSDLTPKLIGSGQLPDSIDKLPAILSNLVNATMGSFHFGDNKADRVAYYNFPSGKSDESKYRKVDSEIYKKAIKVSRAECTSFLSSDIETLREPPFYYSVISYPIVDRGNMKGVYIGYNKEATTPIDSSIFGENDIALLNRAEKILNSIYSVNTEVPRTGKPTSLDELLEINRNLLVSKLQEEIDRAERYHNTFTVTAFRIYGLKDLLEKDHRSGLKAINSISNGLRKSIRKTDYFSWIEHDLFAVLSLESLGRIKTMEERLNNNINNYLKSKNLYDSDFFHSKSAFTRFPGKSKNPFDIIREAKSGL